MKKRKLISTITSVALLAFGILSSAAVPMNVYADANYGFTDEQISASGIKPTLSVSKKTVTADEAKKSPVQTVSINIKGADKKYSSTGFHVYFDERLTIIPNERGIYAKKGEAITDLSTEAYSKGNCLFLATAGQPGCGYDGTMWNFQLKLPDNVKEGDVFPIKIVYEKGSITEDVFIDDINNNDSKLMQAWIFTKGIDNGYIQIGSSGKAGDSNCDGDIDLSDAVLIMQYLANPDRFGLNGSDTNHMTEQGLRNSDVSGNGDGVTSKDALAIQKYTLKMLTALPE